MDDAGSRAGGEGSAAGKPAYAGVSGSSPTFAPPSTSRLGDYVEIFSDVADSCSIPFLDLPPALDGCDVAPVRARGAGFDYSEVFGGLDSGETAASYEEPLAGPKREEEPCSSSGRTTEEATCSQQVAEASKFSPTHSHEDRMACQEVDRFSSNSSPSDIATTQFNVSYNKTSQGSKEGAMGGETHITQLHAVPAFTFVVDANTFQTIVDDGHPNMLNGGIDNGKHRNKFPATSSRESPKSTENYLRAGQKHSANKYPVPENGRANASHDSCSSSSSILSGDVLSSDTMYLAVSDISLRTQAVRVPPPSRPPPRLFDKQGHPKLRILSSLKIGLDEVSLSKPIANSKDFHARQEVVKDSSPSFSDVQVDVGSDAAACAAAIKEAMELAEAKLKSAKELMKKKSDSLQNRKKLGQHESIKHKEQKLGQASLGQESFDEMLGASEKRNNVTSAAKLTPHYKKKEKVVVLTDKDGQTRQGNDLKSSKLLSKLSDKSEKWKTNKNYHGLANSEKYKMIEEVSEREDSMNKTKIMTMISEFKQSESTNDSLAFEIESNRTVKKNNVGLVACVCEENANPEAHDSHVEEVVKPGEVHRVLEGEKAPLFAGNEKKMEPLDHCKLHYTHDDNVENSKFETAVEACEGEKSFNFVEINESNEEKGKSEAAKPQGEDYEKEINIANVAPEPCKIEEKLNVASATAAKEQREIQVACRSCISKGEGMEAAWKCIDSEKTRREEMQCDAENVNQVEGAMSVHEQEKREEMHMKQQSCISAENELRVRENQEADKLKEDLRKWKSTVRATTLEEQEKLVKETDTAYWQACNGNKAKEAQLELQQWDEKEDATPEPYNLEIFEEQNNYEKGLQVCGNEGIRQIQVEPHFMDKIMSMHAVPVICKRPHNMTLDIQPVNRTEKGGNISYLSLVAMESHPVASKENIPDIKKTEEKEKEIMEKEREQMGKLARRLQEEKEKERTQEEKEKTRLLEEANKRERKSIEEKERARLWKEAKDRERKSEEEKEQARLLEEAKERERKLEEEKERERLLEEEKERERKLKEEKERERLLEEAKERERKLKEEKEQARLLEEAKGRERKLEEEKEQARLLEEAKEREKKLEEEKERARLLEEAKEGGKKLEEEKERTRLLEEAKEMGRKLEEEERARLLEEAKERERRVEEEEGARLIEEAKERERKLEEEKERARLLEEEKERVREGEKDRLAVEKTVRIAVERVISEARQRAFKEAQEKAEKASCEALEKSLTEKAPREARLRADHAAVEHASAEVRGHAVERALAEKAAADAREHAERYNASSRDGTRKENVTEEQLMARDKDGPHDAKFQSTASSSSYQANSDSNDQPDNSFGEGESALGCKAILERHQRITERAALALAEMNMRDILVQREQAERNRLAEHLEADLKRWSNGKKGNLRALLSTLQYILGPESGWQPIPLTDVITTSAVKKAYRKATLCVHPDKLQQRGASIQQKYICEKVFDLLKEAWNRFKSEERLQL